MVSLGVCWGGAPVRWRRVGSRPGAGSVSVVARGKGKGRGGGKEKQGGEFSDTLNLPVTSFDLRANSVVREPELQKWWKDNAVFEAVNAGNEGPPFVLHDGPPYANGTLHAGHALNKILKDIINRYQLLRGRKVHYVPGWDCHGLPIELKVLQSLGGGEREALTPVALRRRAREFAVETVEAQRKQFLRFGVWGEWDKSYLTLNPQYEAAQIAVFGQMHAKGHIYQGFKPVNWSPSSRTALAEAELEYEDAHVSQSVYLAFDLASLSDAARGAGVPEGSALVVWTTTPWTIPANMAAAVNRDFRYARVEVEGGKTLLVAEELAEQVGEVLGGGCRRVGDAVLGADLVGCAYAHPLTGSVNPVVHGDHVTADSGTGVVHIAPGHGLEDYFVGLNEGLEVVCPVDGAGKFTEAAGPDFAGLEVLGKGNVALIEALESSGALLKRVPHTHRYPYDWRTKKPTIFRATEQWFASVSGFAGESLSAIDDVQWLPARGKARIVSMVNGRSDWCISRQRAWGVPIPVFYHRETGEALITPETIEHVRGLVAERGSDAWWELGEAELLPAEYAAEAGNYVKGTDTMDVWFDSGSSWASVLPDGCDQTADLYLEGSDQHRGWFQSSLLTSVACQGHAPYKAVLTHGMVLDANGRKMSKSIGNTIDPIVVIEGGGQDPAFGADVLRLWVSSVDFQSDVLIGSAILKQTSDMYRKIRGTVRFLLGNVNDFRPGVDAVGYEELSRVDRYMLHRLKAVHADVEDAYSKYEIARVFSALTSFCIADLSNFYLDVSKDRLYINAAGDAGRKGCQTVLSIVMRSLLAMVAPILPHMAEDAWSNYPNAEEGQSVFQAGWDLDADARSLGAEEAQFWDTFLLLKAEVNKVLEGARADKLLKGSLESALYIHAGGSPEADAFAEGLRSLEGNEDASPDRLKYLFLASDVSLADSPEALGEACAEAGGFSRTSEVKAPGGGAIHLTVGAARAPGRKCTRCWNYSDSVPEEGSGEKELCARCSRILVSL